MAVLDFNYIAELVRQAQAGDSDAFAELYMATYQNQYRFACNYLKDIYAAQDAVQETYITALRNLNKLRDPMLVIAWLNQINFRICYRMQQNNTGTQLIGEEALINREATGPNASPENEVITIDSREYLLHQVMNLPFTESQVILLRYYRNMKIDEIARLMEISRSTVKRYMNSGISRLRKTIDGQGKGGKA